MFFGSILVEYITWHYGNALGNYVRIVRNGRDFIWYFFSIPVLARTLLAPYKRIQEPRTRRFDLEDWAGSVIINLLSRLIGMFIRLVLLAVGLASFIIFMVLSVIGFGVWLAGPILVLMSVLVGFILILVSQINV